MTDDLRARIGAMLNEQTDETLRGLIEAVFAAETTKDVQCRECGHWTPHTVPDPVARAKALDILANQSWGKPATNVHITATVTGSKPVAEMTLAEIEAEWLEMRTRRALPPGETP